MDARFASPAGQSFASVPDAVTIADADIGPAATLPSSASPASVIGTATSLSPASVVASSPASVLQSVNRQLIDGLHVQLLSVAVPLTLFVLVVLGYAVVRGPDDEPAPTMESPWPAGAWTVGMAIVLLFVALVSYPVLASPYLSPGIRAGESDGTGEGPIGVAEDDAVVEVVAHQWEWRFTYPGANVTTKNELVVPADENVTLRATSEDVTHSLAIRELGVRRDVYPDAETTIRTRVHATGEYAARCSQFCGAGHAEMHANVTVVDRGTYDEWLGAHRNEENVTEAPSVDGT